MEDKLCMHGITAGWNNVRRCKRVNMNKLDIPGTAVPPLAGSIAPIWTLMMWIMVLLGTILNRTYDTHNNLYIYLFLLTKMWCYLLWSPIIEGDYTVCLFPTRLWVLGKRQEEPQNAAQCIAGYLLVFCPRHPPSGNVVLRGTIVNSK